MPYSSNKDLPLPLQNVLPPHAQDIYRSAFNNAWNQYKDPQSRKIKSSREQVSHKVAWAAVKKKFKKIDHSWHPI